MLMKTCCVIPLSLGCLSVHSRFTKELREVVTVLKAFNKEEEVKS